MSSALKLKNFDIAYRPASFERENIFNEPLSKINYEIDRIEMFSEKKISRTIATSKIEPFVASGSRKILS